MVKALLVFLCLAFNVSNAVAEYNNSERSRQLMEQALESYEEGDLTEAAETIEKALYLDSEEDQKLKEVAVQIITDLGMDYGVGGEYEKSLNHFNRAKEIIPDDKRIIGLIEATRLLTEETEVEEKEEEELKRLSSMLEVFEDYRRHQESVIKEYDEIWGQMQAAIEESVRERRRLQEELQEREELLEEVIEERRRERLFRTGWILALVFIVGASILFVYKNPGMKRQKEDGQPGQDSADSGGGLSEYDKKLKKIEIIESELAGENIDENQTSLNMLEQFLDDEDFRIRLRIVEVIHRIDPGTAVDTIRNIINSETGVFQDEACRLLGRLESGESVKLLLELADERKDIQDIISSALIKASKFNLNKDLKEKVKRKLDEYGVDTDWVG